MKILLAEYTVHHDPSLAPEGAAMLECLTASFKKIGYEPVIPDKEADFGDEIRRLAPECSEALVIAPDQILSRYTKIIEDLSRNIGCNSFSVALCANKKRTGEILKSNGIDVPAEVTEGKRVIKEIYGCGSLNMRYADEEPEKGEFGQEYLDGEHLSVSLVGSRIIGEVCLYYTGEKPLVLAINRQNIEIEPDGHFRYGGGETPVIHPRGAEIITIAQKTMAVLGCQGYTGVDLVVTPDRIVVVDVNPRPTTSIIGISACMDEEIGDILLKASYGKAPAEVHLTKHARFDKNGRIEIS